MKLSDKFWILFAAILIICSMYWIYIKVIGAYEFLLLDAICISMILIVIFLDRRKQKNNYTKI